MPNYFTELQDGPSGPSYEVKDKEADHSITALIEESPATEAHNIDTYLVYNHEIYQVKTAISIGDTLTVGTNIEVADIPEGTIIFTDDESSAPAGCVAHVIVNDSGVTMAQRNKLKFVGLDVTDDSTSDATVISNQKTNDAIEAIVNVNGACNVFAIDNPILLTGVEVSNNGIINTSTDAIQLFNFMFRAFVSDSPILLAAKYINEIGDYTFNVTIPNNTQRFMFKHDGSNQDLAITIPSVPAGNYKLTFTVDSCDPTTVGGLVISNIMLYDARLNPTGYIPYSMTNRKLTERVTPPASTITTGAIISQIYTSGGWKWSLFVPLPLYILDKYNISVDEAQVAMVAFLTVEDIGYEDNGIYVIVSEDLTTSAQYNRRSLVKLTFTPKS